MIKLFRSALLTAVVAAALVHPSAAQTRAATLTGRVVDQSGAAIPRASISVRRDAAAFARQIASDGEGRFELTDLLPGEYTVTVTSTGFTVAADRLTLHAGQNRQLELTLRVGSLSEDVVVLAPEVSGNVERLRRLPGSVEVLDRETLDRANVMTTNEALRKIPGLNVRDEEGLGLRPNIGIRGLNPTRSSKVLLLEDGIPLTDAPYGDNASYYHPPIDRFESVEVLKGSGQIVYGPQTVGGVVNYITRTPPAKASGSLTLIGGNRDYFNGHLNYGGTLGNTGLLFD